MRSHCNWDRWDEFFRLMRAALRRDGRFPINDDGKYAYSEDFGFFTITEKYWRPPVRIDGVVEDGYLVLKWKDAHYQVDAESTEVYHARLEKAVNTLQQLVVLECLASIAGEATIER